jgi:hypothetical protein
MTPEEAVDTYLAAWSVDGDERLALLRRALTDDAETHAHDVHRGVEAIADSMTRLEAHRTSPVQKQHGWLRFEWRVTLADGSEVDGLDVAQVAEDGRLRRLVVFTPTRIP